MRKKIVKNGGRYVDQLYENYAQPYRRTSEPESHLIHLGDPTAAVQEIFNLTLRMRDTIRTQQRTIAHLESIIAQKDKKINDLMGPDGWEVK